MPSTGKPDSKSASLEKTLDKTRQAASEVRSASDNLSVIHTVLEQEVPEEVQVGEVAQAIKHTEQIEKRLAGTVKTLVEANAALAAEVKKQAGA